MRTVVVQLVLLAAILYAKAQCDFPTYPEPGLYPSTDSFDCIIQGEAVNRIIHFQNFGSISGVTVEWLRFDSIKNMPCGLSYSLNDPDFTYMTNEKGCIYITGITNADTGQYELKLYLTMKVSILPNAISCEICSCSGSFAPCEFYFIRVKASVQDTCPAIRRTFNNNPYNMDGCTVASIPYILGVKELVEEKPFQINPNPVQEFLDISFGLIEPSQMKIIILNSLGQSVYNTDAQAAIGENKLHIDLRNLRSGLYFLSVASENQNVMVKKFILE